MKPTTSLLAACLLGCGLSAISLGADGSDIEARLHRPPSDARIIKIIHNWPDQLEAQDGVIRSLLRQGFGGVVCNVSFTDYLESETKWAAFKRAVAEARKAGMVLWLYDEKGYPSGAAGGLVLPNHPEWEARGLLAADIETSGGAVTLETPPGQLLQVRAYPIDGGGANLEKGVDLAGCLQDRVLRWQPPQGRWHVLAISEGPLFEGTHATMNLSQKMPYVNLLEPEATAKFLEVTHARYAKHLGIHLGQWFEATFTDEPSLMSLFLRPMPWRAVPWSRQFASEFRRRRGYAIEQFVPALFINGGPDTARRRYDFWKTVGELVAENFFGQIQTWCRQHHVPSGGHLLMEEDLLAHVPLYGDFFACIRKLDAPSIDCLTSLPQEVPWWIARLLASAGELEGNSLVMSETSDHSQVYRPAGDKRPARVVTEAEIRGTCNRLMVSGVNAITSYYSFKDLTDEQLNRLNDWVGRCCTMLRGGHQVADVALLYPVESLWPRYVPAQHLATRSPEARRIQGVWRTAAQAMFDTTRDFVFVDSKALVEARAIDGVLVHGRLRWRVVVLPAADTLPLAAWENLASFVRQRGVVVALGALPANSESEFPSERVQQLAKEMFGSVAGHLAVCTNTQGGAGIYFPPGLESLFTATLDRLLAPKVAARGGQATIRATHRRVDDHELYFLVNDGERPWEGTVDLAAVGPGELLDPCTGKLTPLSIASGIPLSMESYGAVLLRFPKAALRSVERTPTPVIPQVETWTIPMATPQVARGEFVREELSEAPASGRTDRPAWRATGALTKSDTDTFLFVRLGYPQPLDLSRAEYLVLSTAVPEGQSTPLELLVVLQEEGGGDFLAGTGRSLGCAGSETTYVPLKRFQLAGWSKDNDGRLDAGRVREIRVGWGGYLGKAGERIQFDAALPQAACVKPAR